LKADKSERQAKGKQRLTAGKNFKEGTKKTNALYHNTTNEY
jgi:hypothetical protein